MTRTDVWWKRYVKYNYSSFCKTILTSISLITWKLLSFNNFFIEIFFVFVAQMNICICIRIFYLWHRWIFVFVFEMSFCICRTSGYLYLKLFLYLKHRWIFVGRGKPNGYSVQSPSSLAFQYSLPLFSFHSIKLCTLLCSFFATWIPQNNNTLGCLFVSGNVFLFVRHFSSRDGCFQPTFVSLFVFLKCLYYLAFMNVLKVVRL